MYAGLIVKTKQVRKEIQQKESQTQTIQSQNIKIEETRKIIRSAERSKLDIQNTTVTPESLINLLDSIEKLSDTVGIPVVVGSVSSYTDKDTKETILKIAIQTTGPFAKVYQTLAILENFPQALVTKKAGMVQHEKDNLWDGNFSFEITQTQ